MKTNSNDLIIQTTENLNVTYSTGANFVPLSTGANDAITIVGAPNKTVRIKRISLTGDATTPVTVPLTLVRRGVLPTGGTFTSAAVGKIDVSDNVTGPTLTAVSTTTLTAQNNYQIGNGVIFNNIGQLTVSGVTQPTAFSGTSITSTQNPGINSIVTFSAVSNSSSNGYVAGPTITTANTTFLTATNTYVLNQPVVFAAVGSLTNLTAGTIYYVVNPTSATFGVATTPNGAPISVGTTLGSPVLNGISPFWPYYVTATSGSAFSIAATPGGSALSFTNTALGSTVVNGFSPFTYYYVTAATPTTFSVASTSGGSAISFTGAVTNSSIAGTAGAVVNVYTANPSTGTSNGILRLAYIGLPASGSSNNQVIWQWGDKNDKALILRGSSDSIAINFGSTAITGGLIAFDVQWEEDNS